MHCNLLKLLIIVYRLVHGIVGDLEHLDFFKMH